MRPLYDGYGPCGSSKVGKSRWWEMKGNRRVEVGLRYLPAFGGSSDVIEQGLPIVGTSCQDGDAVGAEREGAVAGVCCWDRCGA
jgi:hypothetical protein